MTPSPAHGLSEAQPLTGLRVLDFTTFLSGPFATQILGDLGADVVKLEAPTGDLSRTIPPHFVGTDSAYYLGNNRNKRSIVVDLKSADGAALASKLVGCSDVVVENFRPGVAKELGLDPDRLRAAHPELVWASISGFGQHGPLHDRPAYDLIVQALSGVMSLTGEPGRASVRLGIPAGDLVAGLYAAIGVLAALTARDRRGRTIDISMLDGQLAMLSYQAVYSLLSGHTPGPQGSRHDSIPTYRTFTASDGREVAVTANTERMWRSLCAALELDKLCDDTRFTTPAARLDHAAELWAHLEPAFAQRPAAEWVEQLGARGVPAALIKTVPEALADARAAGRGMILPLAGPRGEHLDVLGNPINFGTPPVAPRFPPRLGEHTRAVLRDWLKMSDPEIDRLDLGGTVHAADPPTRRGPDR